MKYTTLSVELQKHAVEHTHKKTHRWTHKVENTQLNAHSRNSHRRCQVENTHLNTLRWTHAVDVIGENA